MAIEESAARERLAPYLGKLSECIDLGWNDFERECSHIRHKTSPRSRACIVHDNIVNRARKLFEEEENIILYDRNGTLMLQIEEDFLLRFKKLDEDKISKGINTQERIDFLDQELPELPGICRGTNVIAGYELNRLQTDIKEITVTCPSGKQNSWIIELQRYGAEIISMTTGSRENISPKVRAKNNSSQENLEENNG